MIRFRMLMAVAVLAASPALVQAAPLIYDGNSATGNFWDRPIGSGPSISSLGPVQYHVQAFFTDTTGSYNIASYQLNSWDGYLHLYAGSFDPTDQLTGLVAGNDDGPGGIGSSAFQAIGLTAFTQYFLVTSGFAAGDNGEFSNVIGIASGDANLALGEVRQPEPNSVPEPETLLLLGMGLVGITLGRRRRKS